MAFDARPKLPMVFSGVLQSEVGSVPKGIGIDLFSVALALHLSGISNKRD